MGEEETRKAFSTNLRYYMDRDGLNQADISRLLGVSESAVGKWMKMKSTPRMGIVEKLSNYFGINKSDLLENKGDTNKIASSLLSNIVQLETKEIPILGSVACGKPIFDPADNVSVKLPSSFHADFGLYARGDSMIGADIHDGDLVFFIQQQSVDNGQIAAVFIDNEVTLKRVYYEKGKRLILQSENINVPPIVIEGPDLDLVHIIGRAIAKQSAVV